MRRTWAPKGHTPTLRHWQRHDRVSVLSAVTLSARRHHCGLYLRCHPGHNLKAPDVCAFVRQLLRHLRGPLIVLWDRIKIHRGPLIQALRRRFRRLRIEYLPPYAPELNPDEHVWQLAKAVLANGRPDDLLVLTRDVRTTLRRLGTSQRHLRACITHALPIRLP